MRFCFLPALLLAAALDGRGQALGLLVQPVDRPAFSLGAASSETILTLKQRIQQQQGIAREDQHQVHAGQALEDLRTLADYGLAEGATLHLFWRLAADRAVEAPGGGTASAGPYALVDTLGQPCVGRADSSSYAVHHGFWQTLYGAVLPQLRIVDPVTTPYPVPGSSAAYAVAVESAGLVGTLSWTNALTSGSGAATVRAWWVIEALCLGAGDNRITVAGTNVLGEWFSDAVTIQRPGGWTNRPPAAQTFTVSHRSGVPIRLRLADLAAHWTDPDGHAVEFVAAASASANGVPLEAEGLSSSTTSAPTRARPLATASPTPSGMRPRPVCRRTRRSAPCGSCSSRARGAPTPWCRPVGRRAAGLLGYGDAGFGPTAAGASFTVDAQASHDVHAYQEFGCTLNAGLQATGSWQADARDIHPLSSAADFETAPRTAGLDTFSGLNPNGTWTLFVADVVSGGGPAIVQSWGVDLVAVPEPIAGTAAVLLALYAATRWVRRRGRAGRA